MQIAGGTSERPGSTRLLFFGGNGGNLFGEGTVRAGLGGSV